MGITRYVLPVVIGAMSGMILISLVQMWIATIYPFLPGTDNYDVASLAKAVKALPEAAFRLWLLNYIISSFIAGIIATLVAKRNTARPAVIVGIVLTFAGTYNAVALPQPLWFSIASILIYLPLAYLGCLAVRKKPSDAPSGQ